MPLTRADLDRTTCDSPGCNCSTGGIYFHSRCHPDAPTWARYENSILTVECAVCETTVTEIVVARSA
jgi:hypothetical protein